MWVSIVIGLIVILSIGTVLYQGRDYLSEKIFGKKYISAEEKEFVPYEVELEGEVKTADDSMKALVCAFNSLAIEKKGWLIEGVCPEGFYSKEVEEKKKKEAEEKKAAEEKKKAEEKKTEPTPAPTGAMVSITGAATKEDCDGALYGQTCVECRESEFGMKTITLPDSEYDATKMLAKAAVQCWNDFKGPKGNKGEKNILCNKVVIPGTAPGWVITKEEFRERLEKFEGEVGSDLAGLGTGTQNVDWKFGEAIVLNIKQEFYICANDAYDANPFDADEIFFTRNLNDCEVETRGLAEKEFTCEIKTFELPQEIGSDISLFNWAEEFINKYNDPEYLAYYESFPRGEEAAWHLEEGDFIVDVILFGAVMNTLPVLGKGVRQAGGLFRRIFTKKILVEVPEDIVKKASKKTITTVLGKTGKEIGTELGEQTIKELTDMFGKGMERQLKSQILYDNILKEVGEDAAETARQAFLSKYSIYKGMGKTDDQIATLLKKEIPEAIGKTPDEVSGLIKNVDDVIKKSLAELSESARNKQTARQFFTKYLLKEGGESLNKEAMENILATALTKETYDKLGPEAAEQIMQRSLSYTDEIIDVTKGTDELLKTQSLIGRTYGAVVGQVNKEFNLFANILSQPNKDTLSRFLLGVTPKEIGEAVAQKGGALGAIGAAAARYNPIHISIGTGKIVPIPRPLLVRSLVGTAYKTTRTGIRFTSDAAGAAWHSRAARYTLAYLLATQIAESDAKNDKLGYNEENTLILQKPYDFDAKAKYFLSDETNKYYLNLHKYQYGDARFFLASPCKADLTIPKTDCDCNIYSGDYILKSNNQPFDPASVKFKSDDAIHTVYKYDELSKDGKRAAMDYCLVKDQEFGVLCNIFVMKDPEAYEKFTKYVYKNVYSPAIDFMQKYKVDEEKIADIIERKEGDVSLTIGHIISDAGEELRPHYEFGAFCFFAEGGIGPCSVNIPGALTEMLVETRAPELTLRKTPLSYEEFKKEFDKVIASGYYENIAFSVYHKLGAIRKGEGMYFMDMYDPNGFLDIATRHTYLNYNVVEDSKIDKKKIAKLCNTRLDEREPHIKSMLATKVSIACFNAQPSIEGYPDYNNGHNYCFSSEHAGIETAKDIATGISIAIDFGAGIISGGLAEAPVAALTGLGSAWFAHEMDKKKFWPNH
ncbi:hypothetical protein KY346_03050 [Candidatus Woesearchaeota archaeon]|nr:hypothetical protein [Candidatus Woesearchaeota archaeon]